MEAESCFVGGHYFVDAETKTRVRLNTETDALLATFVFGVGESRWGIPRLRLSVFDELLKRLRDDKCKTYLEISEDEDDLLHTESRSQPGPQHYSIESRRRIKYNAWVDFLPYSLRSEMGSRMVDELDALLRDTRFRTDQITFASGGDILFHIAEGRRQAARLRSIPLPSNSTTPAANVPEEIMDHVMKTLAEDVLWRVSARSFISLHTSADERYWRAGGVVRFLPCKDLKTASLVHRTWTAPAQRVLRGFVSVYGWTSLYSALRSPLLGPWTRQMTFTNSDDGYSQKDVLFLFKSIPQHVPNITVLSIDVFHRSNDPPPLSPYFCQHADEVILSLGELKCLKSLTVRGCHKPFILWEAITRMPSLTSLKLNIGTSETFTETEIPISIQNKAPSPSLIDIDITEGMEFWPYLPWLFRTHGEYRIKKLSMGFWRIWPEEFSFRFLQPSLPRLQELTVNFPASGHAFERCAREVLSHCSALRILQGEISGPAEEFIRADVASLLPKTIDSLTLFCYEIREHLAAGDWDARFISFLKVLPNLRAFSFTSMDFPLPELPETQAFCAEKKIQLLLECEQEEDEDEDALTEEEDEDALTENREE